MNELVDVIKKAVLELYKTDVDPELSVPDEQFGDYATNVALILAKKLNKSPRDIAQEITDCLNENEDSGAMLSVAGPGFINIQLKNSIIVKQLNKGIHKSKSYEGKVVVCEFSDPNPFKVLHVGHLYTSIVGDSISRLISAAGGEVHRVNFGGDVGLHVAKSMWSIIKKFDGELPEKLSTISESEHSDWLASCYVEGNSAYDEDTEAKIEITDINKRIYKIITDNDHESPLAQIYWTCRQWSYDYFDSFYERIGVKFEKYYPESEGAKTGLPIVLQQLEKGIFKKSNGAIVFEGEPHGLHTRVFVNSEGVPTYETKDLGANFQKWADYKFDQSIIMTDNSQTEYLKVVLKSIEQFEPKISKRTTHLTHGIVKLAGGVKMSSRLGNFLKATDAIEITEQALKNEQAEVDQKLVMGAIKDAFLKNNLGPDIVFEPEKSVSLHGNSGPYLQYAGARAKSILRKIPSKTTSFGGVELDENERKLAIKLLRYGEVVEQSTHDLAPHQICTYLYELAVTFNRFYEVSKVSGDPRQDLRQGLVDRYIKTLDAGLELLGIPLVEKM